MDREEWVTVREEELADEVYGKSFAKLTEDEISKVHELAEDDWNNTAAGRAERLG